MKKRAVILRSNPIVPDPRVDKEARALAQAGYIVNVVGWDRAAALPRYQHGDLYDVYRLPIRSEYARGLRNLPQLLKWQTGLWRWLLRRRSKYDIIHACDFDTVLPALFCKFFLGKRVIYDIFDFYADHLRATPGAIKRLIRWADLMAINLVDAVIIVDRSRREQIAGSRPRRVEVIYNSPQDHRPAVLSAASPKASKLHLAYVGLLQRERGLLEMLEVLRKHPEWTMDLAGFGGDAEQILSIAKNMPNVTWHGRVLYDKTLELSAAADVLFATYDPHIPNHRYGSPNKIFEAMMLGKPVVVAENSNMDRIITEADCGLIVSYGDVLALEAALSRLAQDEPLRLRLGQNARRAYENTFRWEKMAARLVGLYASLGNGRPK
jgi:glycosyltransferase involved in cell wall biosynthesis